VTYIAPQSKLFGHLDRLAQIQATGRTSAPINVEIDLSNRCSLGCEWCHFAFTHTRGPLAGKREKPAGAVAGGDLMDPELARMIVHELAVAGARSITWTGGGEPTLHPNFDEIVRYAATYDIAQSIYTHGGHIGAARATLLKECMTFVYVSLDAADAVSYKRDKGVDRFAAACEGIRLLAAAEGDATVGVGYLVTEQNWRQAGDAVTLVRELGADYVQFRPTILYDQQSPDAPDESTAWLDDAIPHLEQVAGPGVEVDLARFRDYRDWRGHGYPTCFWSMLQTCITPNGKVWTCVNLREHPAAEIGDLSKETFAEVWERHTLAKVDGDCRVMCRGHLPNQALDEIMADRPHPDFV
jgi:MoaA/NifB/PqqE/SkfB family radical SAM enzyme